MHMHFKDIGQQKVGSKSLNHLTDLQTMCETNIQIWDCFYHNCFGHRHQKKYKESRTPSLAFQSMCRLAYYMRPRDSHT